MKAILCFGDSITFGVGEMPTRGWGGRLKDYFEVKDQFHYVFNLGFPGHTSKDLLERIGAELKTRVCIKRDGDEFLVLFSIGTNDCRYQDAPANNNVRVKEEEFRDNVKKIISLIKKYPAKIIGLGIPPVNEKLTLPFEGEYFFTNERVKLFNDILKESCEHNDVLFLDIFENLIKGDYSKLLKDGLHPNSEGHEKIYQIVKEFLIKNKPIK